MSQKTQSTPHFQSIKSLPVDFKFMDSSTSDPSQNSEAPNGNMMYASIPENGESEREITEDMDNNGRNEEDSPYSSLTLLVDESPPTVDENLDSANSPLRSPVSLHAESKWSDTNAYAAKKNDKEKYATAYLNHLVSWDSATVRMLRAQAFVNLGEPNIPVA